MIKKIKKKGISVMVGYVLLISIGLVIAFLVYTFLKTQIPIAGNEKVCNDGTTITVNSVKCIGGKIELQVKNSGRHRIDDLIIKGKTKQSRKLPNLDMSAPGGGGFVSLSSAGAQHPGGDETVTLVYYDTNCGLLGSDCDTSTPICAGEVDCTLLNPTECDVAIKSPYNLNCRHILDDPITPIDEEACVGIDSCDKLNTQLLCQGLATIGQCCADGLITDDVSCNNPPHPPTPPDNFYQPLDHYQIYSLEIKPERQQPDAQGKNESVICSDGAVTIDVPTNCYIYEVGP